MKHFTIALMLCAVPAMAGAQMVTCTDCTHEVSVYNMGEGGLVAQAAAGAEMVTYVSHCGGITMSGQLMPNADNVVAMLFTEDNGLACSAEGAQLELGPVMDGGWFWITDDMNSAVGPLVNQNVLMNETTMITSAGPSVTMMAGKGAVYMKEMSTGRVGILPNILPEAPMPALRPCGYAQNPGTAGSSADHFSRVAANCALGNGGMMLTVLGGVDPYTGLRSVLQPGAVVTRQRTGNITLNVYAWGNGSGHFTTDAAGDPRLGHLSAGSTPLVHRRASVWAPQSGVGSTAPADLPTVPGGANYPDMYYSVAIDTGIGSLYITPSTTYCGTAGEPKHHSINVSLGAYALNDAQKNQVTPPIANDAATRAARFNLTVACPPG